MTNYPTDIQGWLVDAFVARLGQVFETMAGRRPTLRWKSGASGVADLIWRQPLEGVPGGAAWLQVTESAWTAVGGYILRAAGIEDGDAASLRSTFLETIGQAFAGLANAMSHHLRREVTCPPGEQTEQAGAGAEWFTLDLTLGETRATLELGLHRAMLAALEAPAAAAKPAELAPLPPAPTSKTLDVLLDVELPVSVSFGRALLPLKDVIKLTTGSIVELNRSITEPVEVIVNKCVIARGEVVVVEGNFGVRIQEVVSRQERLRTLD